MTIYGSCHCGAVRIEMTSVPTERLQCNCSLCSKTGWTGVYGTPQEVKISGTDHCVGYVQGDRMITTFHCSTCGIATHWRLRAEPDDRLGVNARVFDADWWQSLPVRHVDGKSR